jgi:hypothetical protein
MFTFLHLGDVSTCGPSPFPKKLSKNSTFGMLLNKLALFASLAYAQLDIKGKVIGIDLGTTYS